MIKTKMVSDTFSQYDSRDKSYLKKTKSYNRTSDSPFVMHTLELFPIGFGNVTTYSIFG